MATRKKPSSSLIERAKAQSSNASRKQCRVCLHPKARKDVAELLKAWAAGDLGPYTYSSMHELLTDTYHDFSASTDGLRRHCRHHEPELWRAVEVGR